jgi:hypothetical protein
MKIQKAVKNLLLVTSAIGVCGLTAAFGSASHSISLQGEVPLICRVTLAGGSTQFNDAGQANLGSASEFCNSGKGYRVYARADGIVDGASLVVDGVVFPLEPGAEFLMASSSTPNSVNRSIVFDAGDTDGGGRLSLRIAAN